ncbi:YfiR family protein [Cupriavidus sp. TMH.W2]|uniref:YfiR family protein n=1 Tax=Cupriavidus sp. TMH.W2 TaxID=3434465 RepID=UPI003D77640D
MAPAPASPPPNTAPVWRRPLLRRGLTALLLAVTLAVLPAMLPPVVTAQPAPQRTDLVARVVLSLLGYARWPVERDPVRLCVDNASRYAARLLEGGTLTNGRTVQTRQVDVLADMLHPACDALYVGTMSEARRKRISAELTGRPVLVIAEEDFECEGGSMFCLNIRDNQVSFRVNLDALARSGVHMHPSVLQLGRRKGAPS